MNEITIKINGTSVEVVPGETLIETAGRIGISIPRLCYSKNAVHKPSCMVCAVKEMGSGQIIPSCATVPTQGMDIDSGSKEILALRRTSLELLLSDHRADCEAPCRMACPGSLDIAAMNRLVDSGRHPEALRLLRDTLIIPATLCYICNAPCEKICRRNQVDSKVEIRTVKKMLVQSEKEVLPPTLAPAKGKKVVVCNSSPAGLAIGYELLRCGYEVTIMEEENDFLLPYINGEEVPDELLAYELKALELSGLTMVKGIPQQGSFDAVVHVAQESATATANSFVFTTKTKQPARQIEEGRMFAIEIDRRLTNDTVRAAETVRANEMVRANEAVKAADKPFNSSFPKLTEKEAESYLHSELTGKTTRCLFCDCHSKSDCKLREFATGYHCKGSTYHRKSNREVSRTHVNGGLYFEPSKCISCGLCVYNTTNGFTFSGRGFEMQVVLPAGNHKNVPLGTADLCPTGALYVNE